MSEGERYTLIQTKLHIPRVSSDLVPRPRLFERLNEALGSDGNADASASFKRKLTLVAAPAGYGKTTLVAS